jgi:hypothetical protein
MEDDLSEADGVGIEGVVFVHPIFPSRDRVDLGMTAVGRGWAIAPMDHHPGVRVLDDPDVGKAAAGVEHVLDAAVVVVEVFDALVSHPHPVFHHPGRRVAGSSPENHPDRRVVELDDNIGVGRDRPEGIPFGIVFEVLVGRSEHSLSLRA